MAEVRGRVDEVDRAGREFAQLVEHLIAQSRSSCAELLERRLAAGRRLDLDSEQVAGLLGDAALDIGAAGQAGRRAHAHARPDIERKAPLDCRTNERQCSRRRARGQRAGSVEGDTAAVSIPLGRGCIIRGHRATKTTRARASRGSVETGDDRGRTGEGQGHRADRIASDAGCRVKRQAPPRDVLRWEDRRTGALRVRLKRRRGHGFTAPRHGAEGRALVASPSGLGRAALLRARLNGQRRTRRRQDPTVKRRSLGVWPLSGRQRASGWLRRSTARPHLASLQATSRRPCRG